MPMPTLAEAVKIVLAKPQKENYGCHKVAVSYAQKACTNVPGPTMGACVATNYNKTLLKYCKTYLDNDLKAMAKSLCSTAAGPCEAQTLEQLKALAYGTKTQSASNQKTTTSSSAQAESQKASQSTSAQVATENKSDDKANSGNKVVYACLGFAAIFLLLNRKK